AAARLADDGEDLGCPGLEPEADVVNRAEAPPEQAAAAQVALRDAVKLEQRRAHDGAPAAKHATRCPGASSIRGGASRRHCAVASAQRGWKRQPGGGSARLGGAPSRPCAGAVPTMRGRRATR